MRIRRLFFPALTQSEQYYQLSAGQPEFHYLANVLRLQNNQPLELFDGNGLVAQATITDCQKKQLQIQVFSTEVHQAASVAFHLYLGISKGDRMDYALQKSTEMGVTQVTPLWTTRSEVKLKSDRLNKKLDHWRGVMSSACEQCYQHFVPELQAPLTLADSLQENNANLNTKDSIAFVCDVTGQSIKTYQDCQPKQVAFFVGPEGGWSAEELGQLKDQGVRPVRLGPRILRTETAPVVMLALAQSFWGDI